MQRNSCTPLQGLRGWLESGFQRIEDSYSLPIEGRILQVYSILMEKRPQRNFASLQGPGQMALHLMKKRNILMVAGVGNTQKSNAQPSLTFIDTSDGSVIGKIEVPGRTRWALYNGETDSFYVNVANPPSIVSVKADDLSKVSRTFDIPAKGPHGLEQNKKSGTLYCACDEGTLIGLNLKTGATEVLGHLSGPPDVIWLNRNLNRLYVAVGDPGVIDVFDANTRRFVEKVQTSHEAHTLTVDHRRGNVHVFLPDTCMDLILADRT
jgi:hypothetical protein